MAAKGLQAPPPPKTPLHAIPSHGDGNLSRMNPAPPKEGRGLCVAITPREPPNAQVGGGGAPLQRHDVK